MSDIYATCRCGSGKKFKFCCYAVLKKGENIPADFNCSKFPIHECKVLYNWEVDGISPVYVTRELTKDSYVFVSYLVDFWCLGVKDIALKLGISKAELTFFYSTSNNLETISYQDARSLIMGAVDFAQAIDITPHSSWNGIPSSFIESHLAYEKKFTFGLGGKPHFSSGPYDHELYDVKEIINKVSKANGNYIIHV